MSANQELILNINKCYLSKYRPPVQTEEFIKSELFNLLSKEVLCFYNNNIDIAKYLVSTRDLTNIENIQYFDKELYNKTVGKYHNSGYTEYYNKTEELADNIGIYCRAPLINSGLKVHIFNSIGLGFDVNTQPDFMYYNKKGWDIRELSDRLSLTFTYVFQCAKKLNLNKIVLSHIGGGWFSALYPNDYNSLYISALEKSLEYFYTKNSDIIKNIKLSMMGNPNETFLEEINKMFKKRELTKHLTINSVGYVPNIMDNEETLYQNAWDPHSYAGNGNKGDNSLDGFIGRNVLMHYLCSGLTNKNIEYIKIE